MKLVTFIVDVVTSHVHSSMGLARRLKQAGYTVEYWGDQRIEELVLNQGFTFRRLESIWSRYQPEIRLPTSIKGIMLLAHPRLIVEKLLARRRCLQKLPGALDQFEKSLDSMLASNPPAFVVFDPFLLAYYPYFKRRGIPGVVLSTKPLPVPDVSVPPYSSYLVPYSGLPRKCLTQLSWFRARAADLASRMIQRFMILVNAYTYESLISEVAERCCFDLAAERVRRAVNPDLHFKSVSEWALWVPEMDFPRVRPLPRNVRYVGPCVDLDRTEPGVVLQRQRKYLIYVSVGTVRARWQEHLAFLSNVILAFKDSPDMDVIISAGDKRAVEALGPTPSNVRLFDFLPQLSLLDVADIAITHAGAGTLRECILKEVPMLAYPNHHDQMGNSARIVYHGLGLRGRRNLDGPSAIRRKVFRILSNPDFRSNIRQLKNSILHCQERLLEQAVAEIRTG